MNSATRAGVGLRREKDELDPRVASLLMSCMNPKQKLDGMQHSTSILEKVPTSVSSERQLTNISDARKSLKKRSRAKP